MKAVIFSYNIPIVAFECRALKDALSNYLRFTQIDVAFYLNQYIYIYLKKHATLPLTTFFSFVELFFHMKKKSEFSQVPQFPETWTQKASKKDYKFAIISKQGPNGAYERRHSTYYSRMVTMCRWCQHADRPILTLRPLEATRLGPRLALGSGS